MGLPRLTHLQFAIIDALGANELSGRELRKALKARNINKSGPAFYQLMARLEETKFVAGEYHERTIEGQRVRERKYSVTGEGHKAAVETRTFYEPKLQGGEAYA